MRKLTPYSSLALLLAVLGLLAPLAGVPGAAWAQETDTEAEPQTDSEADSRADSDEESVTGGLSDYTMGVYLLETQSPEDAVPYLTLAWQKSQHDPKVGLTLADALFRMGDLRNSEVVLDQIIAERGESYEPIFLKAKIRYLTRRKTEAVELLEQAQALGKPTFDASRLAAKIYIELGRDEDALHAYEQAIEIEPFHPYSHYQYGLLLKRFARYDECERALTEAFELDPSFSDAALELATLHMEMGRYDDAEQVLLRLIENRGDDFDALAMISNLYMGQGRYEVAIRLLETYRGSYDLPREGMFLLGRLYYEARRYDEALVVFKTLHTDDTGSPELARVLGETALKAGAVDEALTYYKLAIEVGPGDYRNYMALFLATSERFNDDGYRIDSLSDDETVALLDEAAAVVEDNNIEGIYLIGVSNLTTDRPREARELLLKAHNLAPQDDRIILNLASALEKLGDFEEAEPYLARLHEMKPDDPTVCNFYGYLLALMSKDLEYAESLILTALKQEPDNGYYIDSLGWVYYQMGKYEQAVTELERASDIVGEDPTILEHLGDAYRAVREYRKALAAYERSNELQSGNDGIRDKIDSTKESLKN